MSLASPVGNILCTPLLIAFLTCSSFIFLLEVIQVPNGIFIYVLDWITKLFDAIVHSGTQHAIFGYAQPSIYLLWLIPATALCIVHHRRYGRGLRGIAALFILACVAHATLIFTNKKRMLSSIACNKGKIVFINTESECITVGIGVLGKHTAQESYVQYTLMPLLLKHTGTLTFNHVIILNACTSNLYTAQHMCQYLAIKNLHMQTLSFHSTSKAFKNLTTTACKQKTIVITHKNYSSIQLPHCTVHVAHSLQQTKRRCSSQKAYSRL